MGTNRGAGVGMFEAVGETRQEARNPKFEVQGRIEASPILRAVRSPSSYSNPRSIFVSVCQSSPVRSRKYVEANMQGIDVCSVVSRSIA